MRPPPLFDGVGDFYDVPEPLPAGMPGELIRVQPVNLSGTEGATALRVMYHTRNAQGHDVASTGIITYPAGDAPPAGWPVLSYGHGTEGLAPSCATSRRGYGPPTYGLKGVVVAADYPGLGPNGQRHSYLSGLSEGHSVIDIVRAARTIPEAHAGTRWASAGVSQGGHAVLFAGQLAATYAPELELLGTVATAPASGFTRTFPGDNPTILGIVTAMALFGAVEDNPSINPADYASPALLEASPILDQKCLTEVSAALLAIPAASMFTKDPRTTEPAKSIVAANEPGHAVSAAPILLLQGDADVIVVPARTEGLNAQLCALGDVTDFRMVPGATHDNAASKARDQIAAWLADRFAKRPAPSTCAATTSPK